MTSVERTRKSRDVLYDVKMSKVMPELIQGHTHDVKPSRLESMRADFQKRLLKEKEKKLIQIYEDNRKKAMARLTKNEPENVQSDVYNVNDRKSVRDFFNERRRMEASGVTMPPMQNHYNLATSKKSNSREISNNLEERKISFGSHRLQPLAPIQRHEQVEETTNNIRPDMQQKARAVDSGNKDYNALNGRAPLRVLKSIPSSNSHFGDDENSPGSADTNIATSRANLKKLMQTKQQLQSSLQPQSATNNSRLQPQNETLQSGAEDKLTEFQKWRMNHLKTGDERYNKINTNKCENSNEGSKSQTDGSTVDYYTNNSNNSDLRPGNSNKNDNDTRMRTNDKEYGDKIFRQQKALDTVRKTKETEEETIEMGGQQRKKLGVERGRDNNMDAGRKDTKYRKQKENKIVLKRHEDKSQEDENEGQQKATEKIAIDGDVRRSILAKTRFRDKRESNLSKQPDTVSSHSKDFNGSQQEFDQDPPSYNKQTPNLPPNSKRPHPPVSKMQVTQPDDGKAHEDTNYWNEAEPTISDLAQCQLCGRSFLPERLKKHQAACAKANKPRKEFDSSKKRVEGTELAKYASKATRPDPPKKKSNWRSKHEEFIQSLHYARKVTQHEKDGLDPRQLTPPKATKNPDYVPCPHCGRTFNVTAAERHIPQCQTLKTRPPPMNTKHR